MFAFKIQKVDICPCSNFSLWFKHLNIPQKTSVIPDISLDDFLNLTKGNDNEIINYNGQYFSDHITFMFCSNQNSSKRFYWANIHFVESFVLNIVFIILEQY